MPKRKQRNHPVSDDEGDSGGEEAGWTQDSGTGEDVVLFSQLMPEPSQSVLPERPGERKNIDKMDREAQEKSLSAVSRMILFRAFEREPIDRLKIIKDAGISGSDRIGSAAFNEASQRLRNVFGFELNRIPKYMENMKGLPAKFKDRHYVLNGAVDDDRGTHSRQIHGVHEGSMIERGFIMLVNGLIFCKGESKGNSMRKILERDLYKYLHRVDDAIPEEPPAQGTSRAKARTQYRSGARTETHTPNADALLEQCAHWDYFVKEKATEENCPFQNLEEGDVLYSMGPRSAMEIGRKQIIAFCASILGEEPDLSMIGEVDDDIKEEEGPDDCVEQESQLAS
ncbi:unnamed protein product [Pseudo-nitzschia multistriata]|uniref:MAGE domain-containing protein n=1 Tax=Pseudo-nitzschia multistriata TaxID=183589 RepID=A0A448ZKL6_9STRA|nr:unnamed protein product [Pseudo-nitzschia multistriata]